MRRSFDLAVCNAMAGSNVRPQRAARIVRNTLAAFDRAVLVAVVEASLLLELTHDDWTPTHDDWTPTHDTRTLRLIQDKAIDKAGVAAIIDTDRVDVVSTEWVLGVRPFIRGRRIAMRTRWVLVIRAHIDGHPRVRTFRILHAPPKRFWALWSQMMRQVRRWGADLGDFNKLARAVAPATGKRTFMDVLIGILTPLTWVVTNKRVADVGGDHNALAITVHHPRKEHR